MSTQSVGGSARADEAAAVRDRSTAARHAARLAADRCARRLHESIVRVEDSGEALDESEGVVQQLRDAIHSYAQALRAENFPPETTIILVKGVVGSIVESGDAPVVLETAAARWAIEAYYSAA